MVPKGLLLGKSLINLVVLLSGFESLPNDLFSIVQNNPVYVGKRGVVSCVEICFLAQLRYV